MIFSILLFISILFLLRFNSFFRLKDCSSWTLSIAFFIKISVAFLFYYIYVYNIGQNQAPSDAIRFMQESKMLFNVFTSSKSDYLSLLTGIGDNIEMHNSYMKESFIWDAGNFTFINDSRNTIRVHSLIQFISHNQIVIHFILINLIALVGVVQLFLSIRKFSTLNPHLLFYLLLLLPSLLFWSSSILKEPFLLFGVGLFMRGLLSNFSLSKKIVITIIGLLILIGFKPYILICIVPAIIFYITFKYIFKFQLLKTFIFLFSILTLPLIIFPEKKQKLTEYISRKQFDLENVGEGGLHAYINRGANDGYYYFKPNQYQNIQIIKDSVLLTKPSKAYFLSVDNKQIPKKVFIQPTGLKWKIHNIMPGTNSYFQSTLIDNSFKQLLLNIPEAIINAILRPFPFDTGSILKLPTMLEAWGVFLFLILSLIFKKKNIQKKEVGIIFSFLIFATLLFLLIGWTTPISGAIVRFRFPAQLAMVITAAILIDYKRIKFWKNE